MQTVIHMVSADQGEQRTGLAIARNILDSGEVDDIAAIAQVGGIQAVLAGGEFEPIGRSLMADGVRFAACTNSLVARDLDESALVDGVGTVPEGAVEIVTLQEDGWAYLRP